MEPSPGFLRVAEKNPGAQASRQNRGLLPGMIGVEPIDPGLEEPLFPANDGRRPGLQKSLNRVEGSAFGQHQDELGPKAVTGRQRTRLRNAAEFGMLITGEEDYAICRHTNVEA